MSRYFVNKFLYQVDADPELLARYKSEPEELLGFWENEYGHRLGTKNTIERTTWTDFTPEERAALINHDYVALFELGAHFFLCLTIYIAMYDEDFSTRSGPLSFQREYAERLSHWLNRDYPPIAL